MFMTSSSVMKASNSSSLLISMAVLSILTMRSLLTFAPAPVNIVARFVFAFAPALVSIAWTSRSITALAFSIAWMWAFMTVAVSAAKNFLTSLLLRSSRPPRPPRRRLTSTCFVYSISYEGAITFNTVSPPLCLRFRRAIAINNRDAR